MPFGVPFGMYHATTAVVPGARRCMIRCSLLPQNRLDLTDLFLNIADYLFTGATSFELRIIAQFPGDHPYFSFKYVKLPLCFVPDTRFH